MGQEVLALVFTAVAGYLLGSINWSIILTWFFKDKEDIRKYGSGNAGMTNVLRSVGKLPAVLTFAGDFLKCVAALLLSQAFVAWLAPASVEFYDVARYVAGMACVLGHIFPIYYGFRGGKGVATLVGAITGIYPPVVLLCFAVWVVILMMTHYVSLASIVAGCCFPIFTIVSPKVNQSVPFIVFSFVTAVLLLYTHRKNIVRLKNGTESKIYIWKPHRKADK